MRARRLYRCNFGWNAALTPGYWRLQRVSRAPYRGGRLATLSELRVAHSRGVRMRRGKLHRQALCKARPGGWACPSERRMFSSHD